MSKTSETAALSPTVGVEEEFLLVDAETGVPVPRSEEVVATARDRFGVEAHLELTAAQVEINTPVCADAGQVRRELIGMRSAVARAARLAGCRAIAVGAPPLGAPAGVITDRFRYRRMAREFGALALEQLICGCHVHVEVPDRETAVQVCNHVRLWLPVLRAITANSPFHHGVDTGHASWRSVVWSRWPVAGPPPCFTSWRHYQAVCDAAVDSGAALDPAMIYWDVRPSPHLPTVEVRAADVTADVDDAVLLAALVRALVATATAEVERGVLAVPVPLEALRTACWRAARDGLAGSTFDVLSGRLMPARHLVRRLVRHVLPALSINGDLHEAEPLLSALEAVGCGADRQRRVFRSGENPAGLLDLLEVDGLKSAPVDGVAVVRISGEVEMSNSDELEQRAIAAMHSGAAEVELDLSEVTFFGSSGITALAQIRAHAVECCRVPVSVVASAPVLSTLRATAMGSLLPLRPAVRTTLPAAG